MAGTLIIDTIEHSDSTSLATNVLAVTNAAQSFTAEQTFSGGIVTDTIEHSDGTSTTTNVLAVTNAAQTFSAQQTFGELKETTYSLTGTDIDPANGSIQSKTVSAATTFTESLEAGQTVVLLLDGGASYTITWPTMTWVTGGGNTAPGLTANDVFVFWKVSTTLYGAYVGSYT